MQTDDLTQLCDKLAEENIKLRAELKEKMELISLLRKTIYDVLPLFICQR
jgi:hypothetical protein